MWQLKNLEVLGLHPTLNQIAEDVKEEFGIDVITSAYRPGDKGVHGYFRGLDMRCRNASLGHAIEDYVNERYEYDPKRPPALGFKLNCALWHKVENGGYHLHLQVHPNTKKREGVC